MAEHRIVAPKVAGSSPVGHPLVFGVGKPDTRTDGDRGRVGG